MGRRPGLPALRSRGGGQTADATGDHMTVCLTALCGIVLANCSSAKAPYSNTDLRARCESKNGRWYGDPYGNPTHGFCEFSSPR